MVLLELSLILNLIFILTLGTYPLIVALTSVCIKKRVRRSEFFIQPVSIIIACYNEEKFIKDKLDSFLDPGEWIESSEIIVVSAGSTDMTNSILSEYQHNTKVKILIEHKRISKISAINKAVHEARNELLVFSDCRQTMKKGSVKKLVQNFNDPNIGTVTATLADKVRDSRFSFRNLLNYIAHSESKTGSCLNVFGALYAQRKSLFTIFPTDLLFDDLFVVVSTIIQGKRLIMEPSAIIYDVPFHSYYSAERIHRLARGLLLYLTKQFKMIKKLPPLTLFRFIVFKYFKLLLPFIFLLTAVEVIFLCIYFLPFYFSIIMFTSALVLLLNHEIRNFCFLFLKINYHLLLATFQFIFINKRSNEWEKLSIT